MELTLEFWYLFLVAIAISTVSMAAGIGGAVFFTPILLIGLNMDPSVAVGTALVTELIGFLSGLSAYVKAKLIDYKLGANLLVFSIPLAILGSIYGKFVSADVLKAIFAVGIIFIGYQLFIAWRKDEMELKEKEHKKESEQNYGSELVSSDGTVYRYTRCNKGMGRFLAAIGGAFTGMISTGLAELLEFQLVAKCKIPTPVAIATSVFVVVVTVLFASIGHFYEFFQSSEDSALNQVLNIIVFTIPGVIIGGQLGPRLQKLIPKEDMKVGISILFVLVGALMLFTLT